MDKTNQRGSALLMLFIAVALFGLLSFAFMQGSRNSSSTMTQIQSQADATRNMTCTNSVNAATKRLQLRGCGTKISYNSDGSNANSGAPTDGSCSIFHISGAGLKPCGTYDPSCLKSLTVGQACAGVIYAGDIAGHRVYAASTDTGYATWNNGTANWISMSSSQSSTNGATNTDALTASVNIGAPYKAAQLCRALGTSWYLPAKDELNLLRSVRSTGAFSGTFDVTTNGYYWSSTDVFSDNAIKVRFSDGTNGNALKNQNLLIRCVRSD